MLLLPEIIDYIFSFLSTDLHSLESCAIADPVVLAPIAERYLHYHIIITNDDKSKREFGQTLEYTYLTIKKLLAENSLIANYVRILDIRAFHRDHTTLQKFKTEIVPLLPLFSQLERIVLTWWARWAHVTADLIAALGHCMRSPSLTELQFNGSSPIPFELFDNWKNIKSLKFDVGYCVVAGLHTETAPDTSHFQLESLSIVSNNRRRSQVTSWAKEHARNLRSLSLRDLYHKDLLKTCSPTLTKLRLDVVDLMLPPFNESFDLSLLQHLQELIIRANIHVHAPGSSQKYSSSLPVAINLLKTSPPLQRLVLEFMFWNDTLLKIDLSSMAMFANNSSRQIEIRMKSQKLKAISCVPADAILSYLADCDEGLLSLYWQGVLVVPEPAQASGSESL